MFSIEEGEEYYYFGGQEGNPILNNIDKACQQMIDTTSKEGEPWEEFVSGNYLVSEAEKQAVLDSVESGSTLKVKLAELKLVESGGVHCLDFPTKGDCNIHDPSFRFNYSQRAFVEAVYGQGKDFVKNMNFLARFKIEGYYNPDAKIIFSRLGDIRKRLVDGAIAQACWLDDKENYSCFWANYSLADIQKYLCGIRA